MKKFIIELKNKVKKMSQTVIPVDKERERCSRSNVLNRLNFRRRDL